LLEPPVVEDEHLRLRIFEIEFTVVRAFEAASEMSARGLMVEASAVEKRYGGYGHAGIRIRTVQPKISALTPSCEVARILPGARAGPYGSLS
jgi:hypothetical protein